MPPAENPPHISAAQLPADHAGVPAEYARYEARHADVRVWGVETEGADAMSRAFAAGGPTPIGPTSIVTTLSAPHVSQLTYDHVRELVDDIVVVSDADAVRGTLTVAEDAKLWAEPAAGCLVPAAHRLLDRVGPDAHLGFVVCGGNVTTADVAGWVDRFSATPFPARVPVA